MTAPPASAPDSVIDAVLPTHLRKVFDPAEVFAERVCDRKVVYLDTNIWIDLREAASADARLCRSACERAAADGRAVFPLSYASVGEVLENPSTQAALAQSSLMDALSLGVTFRRPDLVYAMEAEAAHRYLYDGDTDLSCRPRVFTSMPDCLRDGGLAFPEGWRPEDAEWLITTLRNEASYRSLRWLVEHLDLPTVRENHKRLNNYVARMEQRRAERDAALAGKRWTLDEAIHEERVYLFREHLLPGMRKALFAQAGVLNAVERIRAFRREHGDGSKRRFADVFRTAAPALEMIAQMHARRAVDSRRKPEKQDFWDMEHVSLAPIYADAFVTRDGSLATLLRGTRKPPAAKAALLSSLGELRAWLAALS